MLTVTDHDVKNIALRESPEDFSMQKYVYDKQSSAKRYMASVNDSDVKNIALRESPNDYSMYMTRSLRPKNTWHQYPTNLLNAKTFESTPTITRCRNKFMKN